MESTCVEEWAHQTFAAAALGDPRRTKRLVAIAAAVASRPGGTVTRTIRGSASKEGAFRFLESRKVRDDAIATALFESTGVRCTSRTTYVAVDQTDLSFVDRKRVRGLGPVCYRNSSERRALHAMNALALDQAGTVVGLLHQQLWLRPEEATPGKRKYRRNPQQDRRPAEQRESWQWVRCLRAAKGRIPESTRPWFVADRAADFHGVLCELNDQDELFTVRSCYDRTIERNGARRSLWSTLSRGEILGHTEIVVPAGPARQRRRVTLEVRAVEARVRVRQHPHSEVWRTLSCVRVREVGRPPAGESRIEWKLLSNRPVSSIDDALAIVRSYTLRWRIEEFHKTWKSGACNVENSQLRSLSALKRWATILAAVATRIERLKHLSRKQPEMDALKEFSQEELDAAITLSCDKKFKVGDPLDAATSGAPRRHGRRAHGATRWRTSRINHHQAWSGGSHARGKSARGGQIWLMVSCPSPRRSPSCQTASLTGGVLSKRPGVAPQVVMARIGRRSRRGDCSRALQRTCCQRWGATGRVPVR
jgi:hypothetical protein